MKGCLRQRLIRFGYRCGDSWSVILTIPDRGWLAVLALLAIGIFRRRDLD